MATTAAEEFDAMPMNNFATQSHIVQHMTDLQTTLTQTSTAISGQTLGVQIEITNQGPSDTTDSFVTLPFPIFLSLNDLVTSQGGCTSSMGLINCELGSIANAATTTLDILFDIDSDVSLSTFSLTATASDGSDIILTNNADTLDIMLDTRVDLAVVVTAPAARVSGELITYFAEISNSGPTSATDAILTFILDSSLEDPQDQFAPNANCLFVAPTLECNFADIPALTSTFVSFSSRVPSTQRQATLTTVAQINHADDTDSTNDQVKEHDTFNSFLTFFFITFRSHHLQ